MNEQIPVLWHQPGVQSEVKWSERCLVVSASLQPLNSPGQNTGAGSCSPLQRIFPTQGLNLGLPHSKRILYQLSHKGSPRLLECVAYPFSGRSSRPRNWTRVSCTAGGFFTNLAISEALRIWGCSKYKKPNNISLAMLLAVIKRTPSPAGLLSQLILGVANQSGQAGMSCGPLPLLWLAVVMAPASTWCPSWRIWTSPSLTPKKGWCLWNGLKPQRSCLLLLRKPGPTVWRTLLGFTDSFILSSFSFRLT